MRRGQDIAVEFPGLYLVHHNLPGKEVGFHQHSEHLLFIPLQGEIRIQLENRELKLGPGKMAYLPAQASHQFSSASRQGERLIALIQDKNWNRSGGGKFGPSMIPVNQLLKEILFYLLVNAKTRNLSSLLEVLIQTLSESLDQPEGGLSLEHLEGKVEDPRLKKALQLIHSQYEEDLSMASIAKGSGLSLRSLNRLFLEQVGMTPKQALVRVRIEKARELIISGRLSVSDAAFEVGYRSLSPFIHAFRQVTGQLPSEIHRIGRKQ